MKCTNYYKHLHSYHFKLQRDLAWFLSLRCCSICFKRYGLEPHHLGYLFVDTFFEWLSLRFVCNKHHKKVQYILGFILHGTLILHIRYYYVKITWLFTFGIYRFVKWLITSYWIPKYQKN